MYIDWIFGGLYLGVFATVGLISWSSRNKLGSQEYAASSAMSKIQLIIAGVLVVLAFIQYNSYGFFNIGSVFVGAILVHVALDKFRIGDNGVYIEGVFISWDEIENYNWSVDSSKVLVLKLKRRRPAFLWRKIIKWKAIVEDKSEISRLLKQYGKQSIY